MEYEIVIVRAAMRDLEQIRAYIARDNSSVAQTFGLKLLDEAQSLRTFPERGGFIPERPGARFVMVNPYLVVYRILEEGCAR
ncbi:MAG TPA: type II toxin-antitoxin system RelE/ParE family toxin [Chthoniobacter sp.]|nr:type II toxin-antitoxin system RelE/ParE family toxin [Chthoniobacter sp.]